MLEPGHAEQLKSHRLLQMFGGDKQKNVDELLEEMKEDVRYMTAETR